MLQSEYGPENEVLPRHAAVVRLDQPERHVLALEAESHELVVEQLELRDAGAPEVAADDLAAP
jgi:hypothetical protein